MAETITEAYYDKSRIKHVGTDYKNNKLTLRFNEPLEGVI